jgi:hypothetical protein
LKPTTMVMKPWWPYRITKKNSINFLTIKKLKRKQIVIKIMRTKYSLKANERNNEGYKWKNKMKKEKE